jgi:DNA-binding MarR family transcriptional regulator
MISAEELLCTKFRKLLMTLGLSEYKFATLVSLFALDPMMPTSADLAYHAAVSRSAMTEILDQMEASQWIIRHRQKSDRRVVLIEITNTGRQLAEQAVNLTLESCEKIAHGMHQSQRRTVMNACSYLARQAGAL